MNRETQKLILEKVKTNNSGEADKPRVSLARENRPDSGHVFKKNPLSVAAKVLRVLRKGKMGVFDMGKVSHSFQDDFLTGAGDIEQKAVSTARKHQANPPILYIPVSSGNGDIIISHFIILGLYKPRKVTIMFHFNVEALLWH